MSQKMRGFTLIELITVVAIIATLAAIALPAYGRYRVRASEGACHAEMKQYANFSLATLQGGGTPNAAPLSACASANNATLIGIDITATPRVAGARQVRCDMSTGACRLL